ncbi:thioesterase [Psychrobacter arenosus]|uniref:thioesterase n=1 Tax=Psychrobacter arenosus TaxID=256326 RepID=UPI0019186109|nr:thioesterase [Psychrobacter arenosus]
MSKQALGFTDGIFVFETVLRVRSTEVDTSQYMTIEALTAILVEVRSRFFYAKGIKEIKGGHQGLVVDDLTLVMHRRVRVREDLLYEVGIVNVTYEAGCLAIKVSRMGDRSLVAQASLHFVNFDYRLNHIIAMNAGTKEALAPTPVVL